MPSQWIFAKRHGEGDMSVGYREQFGRKQYSENDEIMDKCCIQQIWCQFLSCTSGAQLFSTAFLDIADHMPQLVVLNA